MVSAQISEHEIQEFISDLALVDGLGDEVDDATRVRLITALESLKAAAAAAQARVTVAFAESQRATQQAAGIPREKIGVGIAEQVALARRESPSLGSRHLGLATALVTEMPHTLAALTTGELSEWRATLITRATAVLAQDHRRDIDSRLAGRLGGLSDKQVAAAANALAYEVDPRSVVERHAYARGQRRVSIRPAPDTMAYLTALLPAHEAVAVYAALTRAAATARSDGDPRSTDQVKADTLVERVTGQTHAHQVPIEIGLVMTDTALTDTDHTPVILQGYGPIPAALARDILRDTTRTTPRRHRPADAPATRSSDRPTQQQTPDSPMSQDRPEIETATTRSSRQVIDVFRRARPRSNEPHIRDQRDGDTPDLDQWTGSDVHAAAVWLRRLYIDKRTGVITDADRKRRLFPEHLRRLVVARDQWCRTPYCGAPIKHIDHATRHFDGGPTTPDNAQGLCERCNHTKETPGWTVTTQRLPDDVIVILTTTPTGATHHTTAPPWRAA